MSPESPAYFYVYADSGATFEFLEKALQPYESLNIRTRRIYRDDITRDKILQRDEDKILCVFFPGARSGQAYLDDLGETGVNAVKDYVRRGGAYKGICAGAYMACQRIVYRGLYSNKDTLSQWDFFHGTAYGQLPLLKKFNEPKGWQTANVTSVTYQAKTAKGPSTLAQTGILYWGGPLLQPAPGENVTTLATYDVIRDENGRPAIAAASKPYGEGVALFLGVHAEISGQMLATNQTAKAIDHEKGPEKGAFRRFLAGQLERHDEGRKALFNMTMSEILKTGRSMAHLQSFMNAPLPRL